jgi:hypothetical protein
VKSLKTAKANLGAEIVTLDANLIDLVQLIEGL